MAYTIIPAVLDDVSELCKIMMRALSDDHLWIAMKGSMSDEDDYEHFHENLTKRLGPGVRLGVCKVWKAVDESGKILGWTGVKFPATLTPEQMAEVTYDYNLPSGRNDRVWDWFERVFLPSLPRNGFDPAKHCLRQTLMVDPAYQRRGIGRILTQKANEFADVMGLTTYARVRQGAAVLFRKMGYEVLERMDVNLADLGVEGGTSSTFAMKRPPGAKSDEETML